MKIFKIIISITSLIFAFSSCSPDTVDIETQQNSADNVSEAETFSPILRTRKTRRTRA